MWKTFESQGKIVDLYIARKRSRWGKRFGFVRFIIGSDWSKLEEKLNGIWIGMYKLRVNLARFSRARSKVKEKSVPGHKEKTPNVKQVPESQGAVKFGKSFADVVKESMAKNSSDLVEPGSEAAKIILPTSQEALVRLESSLIGELKSFASLSSLGCLSRIEGWPELRMSYLGGLSILLEFPTKEGALDFLVGAASSWKDWFSSIDWWCADRIPGKRIASLDIQGLPLHVSKKESLEAIGKIWGEVVKSPCVGERGLCKDGGLVYVLTSKKEWIIDVVEAKVGDHLFKIRVVERAWDCWEPGEIMESVPSSASGSRFEDGDSTWDGCDDVVSGVAPSPENRPEKTVQNSPAKFDTEGRDDERASVGVGSADAMMAGNVSRKEKDGFHDEGINSQSENVDRFDVEEVAHEFLSSARDMGIDGMDSLNKKVFRPKTSGCALGPTNDGPSSFVNEWANKAGEHEDLSGNGQEGDSINRLGPRDLLSVGIDDDPDLPSVVADSFPPLLADGEDWIPQCKRDGLSKRSRRSKKLKRIKSPCNCYRRKRGQPCKHSHESGGLVGEAFVVNREIQESLDSECLIRRSNQRILSSSPKIILNNPSLSSLSHESPIQEVRKLVSIGNAIGINLENKEDLLLNLLGKGDENGLC
ncbi:hypothetical protein OSB04_000344 [Centaurea solstitialis]|uniref:RRM domain-containing protein n=1 Tax=Centaurea solstitialis TaxID=347529 RepID=A0AA38TWD3_9ASTR|nr:hypothetical protein OSB04_000344 [Centaurea solstitialis]